MKSEKHLVRVVESEEEGAAILAFLAFLASVCFFALGFTNEFSRGYNVFLIFISGGFFMLAIILICVYYMSRKVYWVEEE